jgi:hypothetical protein
LKTGTGILLGVALAVAAFFYNQHTQDTAAARARLQPEAVEEAARCADQSLTELDRSLACQALAQTRRLQGY